MRQAKSNPPRPGMLWSRKHRRWVDPDTRTPERRKRDDEIVHAVANDEARIRELLRTAADSRGKPATEADTATRRLAAELLASLIAAREQAGLSQSEVARRMGVPQPAVVRLEAGTHSPTLATLARYAQALGVELKVHAVR